MPRFTVTMLLLHNDSPRDLEAREQLAAVLPGAQVSEPDALGVFDVGLDADDWPAALNRVLDALVASGSDDHLTFLEHPDLPGDWPHRSPRPEV